MAIILGKVRYRDLQVALRNLKKIRTHGAGKEGGDRSIVQKLSHVEADLARIERRQNRLQVVIHRKQAEVEKTLVQAGTLLSQAYRTAKLPWPDFTYESRRAELHYTFTNAYIAARTLVGDIGVLAQGLGYGKSDDYKFTFNAKLNTYQVNAMPKEERITLLREKIAQYEKTKPWLERFAELSTREAWLSMPITGLVNVFEKGMKESYTPDPGESLNGSLFKKITPRLWLPFLMRLTFRLRAPGEHTALERIPLVCC